MTNQMSWHAIITVHRGNGRPNSIRIRESEHGDWQDAMPMDAHDGAVWVGTFNTRSEAKVYADKAWAEWVTTDEDGWTQWK